MQQPKQQANETPMQEKRGVTTSANGKRKEEYRHLNIMTFGEARLSFLNVLATSADREVELLKRQGDRRYKIKTNGRGLIDIIYEADDAFTVSLCNHSRWVTNIHVDAQKVAIGNVAQARPGQIVTLFVTEAEPRNMQTTFKLENGSDIMLKRIDVRGHNTQWFSIFSHNMNLLMVRPNGDWVAERMTYLTDQMINQAINNYRRSNGQQVLPSNSTVVMRRRQTQKHDQPASPGKTHDMSTQTENEDAREIELLKNEAVYQQRVSLHQEYVQRLSEMKAEYELELERVKLMESRLTRVAEEEDYYAQRKREVGQGIVEVHRAANELNEQSNMLKREVEQFEMEQRTFAKAKETARADHQTQTDPPLRALYQTTGITLSERFSKKVFSHQRLVMGDDGTMTISFTSPEAHQTD